MKATDANYRPIGDGNVHGDDRAFNNSSASTNPGYDTAKSRGGMSNAQVKNGNIGMGSITADTKSDPWDRNLPMNPDI